MVSVLIIEITRLSLKNALLTIFALSLFTILIPFISYRYLFLVDFQHAFFKSPVTLEDNGIDRHWLLLIAQFSLPILLCVLLILYKTSALKKLTHIISENKRTRLISISSFFGITVIVLLFLFFTRKDHEKTLALISFNAYNENWNEVEKLILNKAAASNEYNVYFNFEYNRAIAHQHRLLEDLFRYPQQARALCIAPDKAFNARMMVAISQLYFDLSYIEASRRWADEQFTAFSNSPRLLEDLIKCAIILEEYPLAEKYTNRLNNNLLAKERARDYLETINMPATTWENNFYKTKRKFVVEDSLFNLQTIRMLKSLFHHDSSNIFAAEYLAAYYLLEKDFKHFIEVYDVLHNKYAAIPRACEEAMVMEIFKSRSNELILKYGGNRNVFNEYVNFMKIISDPGNRVNGRMAMERVEMYKNTYWYYFYFILPKNPS
jgi:hypothetical protein